MKRNSTRTPRRWLLTRADPVRPWNVALYALKPRTAQHGVSPERLSPPPGGAGFVNTRTGWRGGLEGQGQEPH